MSVTIQEIAQKTGLSISTVSRVLNNKSEKYRISNLSRKKVLEIARSLNYRPNHVARSLRLKKTDSIALIVPDISNPFFANVTRNIQKKVSGYGYSLIVCNTDENIQIEKEQIELMRRKNVEGFIIMPVGIDFRHLLELKSDKIPLVLLDRSFEELQVDSVAINNYKGGLLATEYLIQNGHRLIAIIQGLEETTTNKKRLEGYLYALKNNRISIYEEFIVGGQYSKASGYEATTALLQLDPTPTAIFATSDVITLGVYQALYEEQLRIPDDMSVISFDDIDFAEFLKSPLTVVRQPENLMGLKAVDLLFNRIMKGTSGAEVERIVLEPELVIRESVKKIIENNHQSEGR